MAKKVYKSLTGIQYTFPVKINDKIRWISFTGDQLEYVTSDKKIQDAIEDCRNFKEKLIGLSFTKGKCDEESPVFESTEFPDVTVLNDAVAVLRGEPYRVNHSKLKSKDAILAVARGLGVSFPNLSVE